MRRRALPPGCVDIANVAGHVETIETCHAVKLLHCPALQRDRARNPFDGMALPAVTARRYRLHNVVLDRKHMVLLHRGRIIAQTNYLQDPRALAELRVRQADVVRIDAECVAAICFDHWHVNYYHWTAHTVPALQAILQSRTDAAIRLILPPLLPRQAESLALCGADKLPAVVTEAAGQYFLPHADYLDLVAGSLDYAISPLSRAAYARISAQVPDLPGGPEKIYIDRTWAVHRRLVNEPALIERLRARGFAIVQPETMTVAQQIALFRGASLVVATQGAGLANIAYCRPGTVVYEIVPSHDINPCFAAMAEQGGLTYWADEFDTGVAGSSYTAPWAHELDVDAVLTRVAELEAFATGESQHVRS